MLILKQTKESNTMNQLTNPENKIKTLEIVNTESERHKNSLLKVVEAQYKSHAH